MDKPSETTLRSRELRQTPTPAEVLLWQHLRANQLNGAKFRRQMPIGPYFADFACPKFRCIVEVDGASHELREGYDTERDLFMKRRGWSVLRFTEAEVRANVYAVLEAIGLIIGGEE
jgi:very-short-patch-repair endonuclease